MNKHLHGERIVILANREAYIHQRTADSEIEIQHPASGLVTALEPVMRACSGVSGRSWKWQCRSATVGRETA